MQHRGDESRSHAALFKMPEIHNAAHAAASDQFDGRMILGDGATQFLGSRSSTFSDTGQVKHDHPSDSRRKRSFRTEQGIASPATRIAEGHVRFQIQRENDALAQFRADAFEFLGARHGFEPDDDSLHSRCGESARRTEVTDAGVDPERESQVLESREDGPRRLRSREGVQVGEVELVCAEYLAERQRHILWLTGGRQSADDGTILIPSPSDTANDNTIFQIENGNGTHGSSLPQNRTIRIFIEADEECLTVTQRRGFQVARRAEEMLDQFVVGWRRPVHVKRDDLLALRDDNSFNAFCQGQRQAAPFFLLRGVGAFTDGMRRLLKEPLSFLAGRSTLAMVHPVDFHRHADSFSVFRHRGIDALRPGEDSPLQVDKVRMPLLFEEGDGLLAAHAALAVDHDFAVARNFRQALWQFRQR
jgi:hypothetical protein